MDKDKEGIKAVKNIQTGTPEISKMELIHKKECSHVYSKAMNQPYPRRCVNCNEPEDRTHTTDRLMDLAIQRERGSYDEEIQEMINIQNASEVLCNSIFPRLQKIHEASEKRGFSFEYDESLDKSLEKLKNYKCMSYEIAGRIMLTIRDNKTNEHVSMVGSSDGNAKAGLHGINCRYKRALLMLELFTSNYHSVLNGMKVDKQVTMI